MNTMRLILNIIIQHSRHKLLVARHIVATDDDLYMQNVLQK
jgi:hypothetical protein